jgi:hypothetical protein
MIFGGYASERIRNGLTGKASLSAHQAAKPQLVCTPKLSK